MSSPHTPHHAPEVPSAEKEKQVLQTAFSQSFSDFSKERVEHLHMLEGFLLGNDAQTAQVKRAVAQRFLQSVSSYHFLASQTDPYIEKIDQ